MVDPKIRFIYYAHVNFRTEQLKYDFEVLDMIEALYKRRETKNFPLNFLGWLQEE